ncbi:MAG: hypothetical protein AAF739_02045 [Pseudomonadota bacterium]
MRTPSQLAVALCAALPLFPDTASATPVEFGWAVDLAFPFIETLVVGFAALIVGWVTSRLNRLLGLKLDRGHAEALQQAVERGVRHAASLVRDELKQRAVLDVESRLVAETAIYLEQLMPDALAHFGLNDETLDRLIRAHLSPDLLHLMNTHQPAKVR